MKLRHVLLLCGLLLAASCTSGTEGIFASIEREEKIISLGGLNANATVSSMTEFGAKYYATGGRALFSKPAAATAWDKSAVDGSGDVLAVGAVNKNVGKIFAVTAKDGGTLYSSTDGTTWTKETSLGSDKAVRLVPIRNGDGVTNQGLLVVTKTGTAYTNVYFIDSSDVISAAVALDPESSGVHSAVFDGTGYYLANTTTIWSVDSGLADSVVLTSGTTHFDFSGLIYINSATTSTAQGGFYVSTPSNASTGGGIYTDASLPLNALTAVVSNVQVDGTPVAFGSWLYNPENKDLWVGTNSSTETTGHGYMEVSMDTGIFASTPDTESHNYQSSVLPLSSVVTFFRASSNQTFAGTWANGLWVWDSLAKTWSQQ